jgi:hypothetical protein
MKINCQRREKARALLSLVGLGSLRSKVGNDWQDTAVTRCRSSRGLLNSKP